MIVPHTADNLKVLIAMVIAELCGSTSPRYSILLLQMLRGIPTDILNANEIALGYFVGPHAEFKTVKDSVANCQRALRLCFNAKVT